MTYEKQTKAVLERLKGNERDLQQQAEDIQRTFNNWNKFFDKFVRKLKH